MCFKNVVEGMYKLKEHVYPANILVASDDYFEFERLDEHFRIKRDLEFEAFVLEKYNISCVSAFGSISDKDFSFYLYFNLAQIFYTIEVGFTTRSSAYQLYVRRQTKEKVLSTAELVWESEYATIFNELMLDLKERIYRDKLLRLKFVTGLINLTDVTIPIKQKGV